MDGSTPVLPRIPLIPGITSTVENLEGFSGFLREVGARKVALLQYNPLWKEKSVKVGLVDPCAGQERMNTWMEPEEIQRCQGFFDGFEIVC